MIKHLLLRSTWLQPWLPELQTQNKQCQ